MILAAWPKFDFWHRHWRMEVYAQPTYGNPRWVLAPRIMRDGQLFAALFKTQSEAQASCAQTSAEAKHAIEQLADPIQRKSLLLKADKALQSRQRLSQEEQLMLLQAKARKNNESFDPNQLVLHKSAERYRDQAVAELEQFPYVRLVMLYDEGRPMFIVKTPDDSWSSLTFPKKAYASLGHRARIANGFDLSAMAHWGKTKAKIRQILLPRANELLQLAGIKRMLAEALAEGKRALVYGQYVFWFEPHNNVGWIVMERAAHKEEGEGNTLWRQGTIISKNHGRIIVLPYVKEDGTQVAGHTKNAPHDGASKPRHPSEFVEIPFHELDGDLMIGLFGELPYE